MTKVEFEVNGVKVTLKGDEAIEYHNDPTKVLARYGDKDAQAEMKRRQDQEDLGRAWHDAFR